jgi:Protein of unknown function (DUF4230)
MPPFLIKWLLKLGLLVLAAAAGFALAFTLLREKPSVTPDPAALVEQVREVARLETLQVRLYKRVSFAPEPGPAASVWGDVVNWVKQSVNAKAGRALVFADVSLGLDLSKLGVEQVRVTGSRIELALPPLKAQVSLRPEDTEVIDSNLDSAQTAKLFELAKDAFEREVEGDAALQSKARASAERQLKALLLTVGFKEVVFVPWPLTARAG